MAEVGQAKILGWSDTKLARAGKWMEEHHKTRIAAKVGTAALTTLGAGFMQRLGYADLSDLSNLFNVVFWQPLMIYMTAGLGLGIALLHSISQKVEGAETKANLVKTTATLEQAQEKLTEAKQKLAATPDIQRALARFLELKEGLAALVDRKLTPHLANQEKALRSALRAIQSIIIELGKPLQPKTLAKIGEFTAEELETKLQGKLLALFVELKKHLDAAGPAIETGLNGLENLGFLLALMGFDPISPEDYKRVVLVGKGGMGDVYKAETTAGQFVALKTCSLTDNAQALNRFFKREAPALQKIDHPNIVKCQAYGWTTKDIQLADGKVLPAGTAVLVMEFVSGGDLADHIQNRMSLSVSEAVIFGLQIIDGVSAAHQQEIIHRDLKTANVLLNVDKTIVKVTDFGVAKIQAATALTMGSGAIGTPIYMSPEQARGLEATEKSDLYAIAEIIFEMIAGQALWKHSDFKNINDLLLAKNSSSELYLGFVRGRINFFIRPKSEQLADLLLGALEQNVNDRFSMEEFKDLLEKIDLPKEASLGGQEVKITAEAPPSVDEKSAASAAEPKTKVVTPLAFDETRDSGSDPTQPSAPPTPEAPPAPAAKTQTRFSGGK